MPSRVQHREPFAQRLVQIRTSKGITQYDLAKMSGVSNRMIAYYETRVRNPSLSIVVRLAKALKVNVATLMGQKPLKISDQISRATIKKAKMMEELRPEDQKTVVRMIERLHSDTKNP